MPCPRGAGVRFLIFLLSLSCFFATCIICVVVVQSWCLHGGGCCCFHLCSCCPFRCSLSELLAPFKLLSMMVVGGTSRGASGALDGELVMISRCPRPGASSYIVLLLVISSRHMFLYDLRFMFLDVFLYMFTERYIQNGRQKSLLKISKTKSRIPSKTQIEFEKTHKSTCVSHKWSPTRPPQSTNQATRYQVVLLQVGFSNFAKIRT